jgi:hypothetical protein
MVVVNTERQSLRYASACKLAQAWSRDEIKGTAWCREDGEVITAHDDVILCGQTIRLLVARNRELGCVFALTSRRILGGRALRSAVNTVTESGACKDLVRIGSFEGWNPLNCSLETARSRMMEAFRSEADLLLNEWESLQPDQWRLLGRAESEWEKLTSMLPCLGECLLPEYEERRIALHVKLKLLGEWLPEVEVLW